MDLRRLISELERRGDLEFEFDLLLSVHKVKDGTDRVRPMSGSFDSLDEGEEDRGRSIMAFERITTGSVFDEGVGDNKEVEWSDDFDLFLPRSRLLYLSSDLDRCFICFWGFIITGGCCCCCCCCCGAAAASFVGFRRRDGEEDRLRLGSATVCAAASSCNSRGLRSWNPVGVIMGGELLLEEGGGDFSERRSDDFNRFGFGLATSVVVVGGGGEEEMGRGWLSSPSSFSSKGKEDDLDGNTIGFFFFFSFFFFPSPGICSDIKVEVVDNGRRLLFRTTCREDSQ
jgi:hypothetical protein